MITREEIIERYQIYRDPLFLHSIVASDKCVIPLYHGTDRRILSKSLEERQVLRKACDVLIEFYSPVVREYTSTHKYKDNPIPLMYRLMDCDSVAYCKLSNSKLYEYDATYLTGDLSKAIRYARRAMIYGELGYVVSTFILATKEFGLALPLMNEEQKKAYELITQYMKEPSQPVVLVFQNIDKSLMKYDDNIDVNWVNVQSMGEDAPDNDVYGISYSFRVSELDFSKAIEVIEV